MHGTFSEFHKLQQNCFKNVWEDQVWIAYWQTHRPLTKEQGECQIESQKLIYVITYMQYIQHSAQLSLYTDTSFEVICHRCGKQNHNLLCSE